MGTLTCVARELEAALLECSAVGKIRKGLALPDRQSPALQVPEE